MRLPPRFYAAPSGFASNAVDADEADPRIIHRAALTFDTNMIMLVSNRPGEEKHQFLWTPAAADCVTMCVYVFR